MSQATSVRKRVCERKSAAMVVKFNCEDSSCYGIATNISEKGMFIRTGICPPHDTTATLKIVIKGAQIEMPFSVRWVSTENRFFESMGIELLDTRPEYLEMVGNSCGA